MKTLIYILPDKNAGVASVVRNLLKYKTDRFKTKVLLIHDSRDDEKRRIKDNFKADKVIRIVYNGKWSTKLYLNHVILKHMDSDSVVVANDGGVDLNALKWSGLYIPVVYILHGDFKHYYNVLESYQYNISKIITVSSFLKEKVQVLLDSNTSISVESIKFPVPDSVSLQRQKNHEIRLVFVGTLNDRKGVQSFIELVQILDAKAVDYQLNIVGSGEREMDLKEQFIGNEKVVFHGKLPNEAVLELYANQDVILLPSKAEGLPVVLVEAMKCGVVPMATNLKSGIPELIEEGVNGYMFDLNDIKGYANRIEELHHDRALLEQMSRRCKTKANAMFDPFEQTAQYENAFLEAKPIQQDKKMKLLDFLPMALAHKIRTLKR